MSFRNLLAVFVLFAGSALAQQSGDLGPSGGAIKGGAIKPGERGGVPESVPGVGPVPPLTEDQARERCRELSGTLRDQCLRDLRNAGAGGTAPPQAPMGRDPRLEPPPQNPQ